MVETSRQGFQSIRGLLFPGMSCYQKKNIEDSLDYLPHDGDIILTSYPKTGTHWFKYIILQIISKGEYFPQIEESGFKTFPFMELVGVEALEAMPMPRMYKHHCPYNLVKKNYNSKVLYIYRHPEDTFTSYYHYLKEIYGRQINLEEYLDDFLSGNVGYGNYFNHVSSFLERKCDRNLLMISYENLHGDNIAQILKVARFLGDEYYETLSDDKSLIDTIAERTSFQYMKNNLAFDLSMLINRDGTLAGESRRINFFRKGTIGGGKGLLTSDQRIRIRETAESILGGTKVFHEWYSEEE